MTDYQKQGTDFLKETETEFRVRFVRWGKYFPDDTYERAIFRITLTTPLGKYSFRFGQSINDGKEPPTPYDVFASLTKDDPDTFKWFCAEYGYDTDSIKAHKMYKAVVKEWENISRIYTPEQLEKMQLIS